MSDMAQREPDGATLFVTDRRFWRRSIGSEQRIAALVLHLAARRERVFVAYVGRLDRRERRAVAQLEAAHPTLQVLARPGPLGALLRAATRRRDTSPGAPSRPAETDDRAGGGALAGRYSATRRAFIDDVLRRVRPRLVIVEFLRLAYTVHPRVPDLAPPPHLAIDTHDVLHRRNERYREAGEALDLAIDREAEIAALARFDTILAIQAEEGELLRTLIPDRPVVIVPHGVALPPEPTSATHSRERQRIGFLGGRDPANQRALEWFVDHVWDPLRERFPGRVELIIAGQICERWDRPIEGATTIGAIDSIERFWPEIDLAINPVRFGSGLKIKNVEALAFARPLLTTTIGAEGLRAASPQGLRIEDTPEAWIATLADWLDAPEEAREIGRAGRRYAEQHLTPDRAFGVFDAWLAERGAIRPNDPPTRIAESAP